jgi:uncharacterized protein
VPNWIQTLWIYADRVSSMGQTRTSVKRGSLNIIQCMYNTEVEDIGCLLFICIVGAVFAAFLRVLHRIHKDGWRKHRFKATEIAVLSVGAFGLGCVLYGSFVEPFSLQTSQVTIQSRKLPLGKSLRIVQISDLHCDGVRRTEDRLPAVVSGLRPNLIVFTGDAANNKAGVDQFRSCLQQLARIAPVYAVYGNHDAHNGKNWKLYDGIDNVTRLVCDSRTVQVSGTPLWIGGVGIDNEPLMKQTLSAAPKDNFSLFLYHYPAGVKAASQHGIDLMCVGHTHGGQVCLPYYGAITTQSTLGREYASGLHHFDKTSLYINRGIGMTGLPVRFCCPPEVTAIDVVPASR